MAGLVLGGAVAGIVTACLLVAVAILLPPPRHERILRALAAFGSGPEIRRDTGSAFRRRLRSAVIAGLDRIAPTTGQEQLSRLLGHAGNPPAWPPARVLRARPLGAIVGAGVAAFFAYSWTKDTGAVLIGIPAGLAGGFLLPHLLVYNAGVKRQEKILRSLPDVMDAMVIGVEAGLGLDAAMAQVASAARGPMADELNRVLQEMRLGVARTEALRSLSARTTVRDLKRLMTALIQAGELGVPVAGILREHAADQRVRRRQRAEEMAQKVPVKLLFPVLLCMFPAIFIVVVGPAIITLAKSFG
ncbi:type II secretion system protein [Paractinoplanes deccanensis]|uniref:Type II secretion system protein n=1 Tax=Paractinoplanes deccanensis TaxID=113561 RepID=A0ABQ3Y529_9ACTN|nr:type II secretion system F family protein [Actinoplanes deccanensis]GID75089.1 type II secretion system protein [Actinoplanes deccanensis]